MEYVKEYIEKWNEAESPKPKNDGRFIAEFILFAKSSDADQWGFDGDNGYCGHTAVLHEHPQYIPVHGLVFEFAYGMGFVKVFTGKHNGFWTPEYISLKDDDAAELIAIIKDKLNDWAGFDS